MEEIREECGIFGIYGSAKDGLDVSRLAYFALYALQHRGQESCGIAVDNQGVLSFHRDMGLVSEVFNNAVLDTLKGRLAVGHVRYSTAGGSLCENVQPMIAESRFGRMVLAHNGNLANHDALRQDLYESGETFISSNDTELVIKLIARYQAMEGSPEKAIAKLMGASKGAYAIVLMMQGKVIGFRDPYGIRPLCIGKLKNSYVFASESCVFDTIGAEFVRDVLPGEIITLDDDGMHSHRVDNKEKSALCVFEYVYFARPDSFIDGISVNEARLQAGRILAQEHPVEADLVIGAPDSALTAAIGYSRESGIEYGHGLIRNRYVGRTFIQPKQELREAAVRIKFSAMKSEVQGKRVIMVDDSIVRGTTTRIIVQMLKDAGAKEVHMRISSPPVKFPCYYGIDTATSSQLIANRMSVDEIRQMIGADSLAYLSLGGLLNVPVGLKCGLCDACFTGNYCIPHE